MKNLISMTDFVLEQGKKPNTSDFRERFVVNVLNYANFLKQPLEIRMFVPCDEDGNVLDEPDEEFELSYWDYSTKLSNYQKAKERCLFEGFIQNEDCKYHIYNSSIEIQFSSFSKINEYIYIENFTINNPELIQIFTIENLISYNLQLTTAALKQIGL